MEIYRLVISKPRRTILLNPYEFRQSQEPKSLVRSDTAIFRVSKAINQEAMDVFYSEHVFKIFPWIFTEPLNTVYRLLHPGLPLIENAHFFMDLILHHEIRGRC